MLLGVTRDTEVAFGKFPYFPYQTETFRYGMVWEWYGKRIRFPIPYHTVVRHILIIKILSISGISNKLERVFLGS